MTLYDRYIQNVLDGTRIAGELEILGVKRHQEDLYRSKHGDIPFYFDTDYADAMIRWVEMHKLSSKSWQGKPFVVEPFQAFYYASVYGWLEKETLLRRFRMAYWCTGRKSAKSEMTAPELTRALVEFPGECQNVIVATKFEQGKYIFDPCTFMVQSLKKDFEDSAEFLDLCHIKKTQYHIKNLETNSFITRWSSDSNKEDGAGIYVGVVDEYHAHKDSGMVDVVSSSQGAYDEPLLKIVTTAGFNKQGPDYALRKKCENVLRRVIYDERLFTMIYTLDKSDIDPKTNDIDPKYWPKSNPLMPISPKPDWMENEYKKAKDEGGQTWVNFLTKNLNIYTDAAEEWVESAKYAACADKLDISQLQGKKCVMGVDLASEHDTTALSWLFWPQDGLDYFYYFTIYYCPEPKFKVIRVDGVFYTDYLESGDMVKTSGDVIDKTYIKADILKYSKLFDLQMIGFDPHKAVDLMTELENEEALPCGKVQQSAPVLSGGNSLWKELLLKGPTAIRHDGNQVTAWQMGNIETYTDGNGNEKFVKGKGKQKNKIDGPVSINNAFVAYLDWKRTHEEVELGFI